jgi:hypothetical protein
MKYIFYNNNQLVDNANVVIRFHKLKKDKTIFKFYKPLLSTDIGYYANIININNTYKLYYPFKDNYITKESNSIEYTLLAEGNSDTSLVTPKLDKYDNIPRNTILSENHGSHNFFVFMDKDNNYRAIGGRTIMHTKKTESSKKIYNFLHLCKTNISCPKTKYLYSANFADPMRSNGLYLYDSKDGINWKLSKNKPIISGFSKLAKSIQSGTLGFDTQNRIIYNIYNKYYIIYVRGNLSEDVRTIYYSRSRDLVKWEPFNSINIVESPNTIISSFNTTNDSLYLSGIFLYPETNMYIGFPSYFKSNIHSGDKSTISASTLLMYSTNGVDWEIVNKFFHRNSLKYIDNDKNLDDIRYRHNIAGFMLSPCNKLFNIYIHTDIYTTKSRIVKYSIRKDGLSSLYSKNGSCLIKIVSMVNKIILNYKTIGNGYIRVYLLDSSKRVIYTSHKITGNKLDYTISIRKRNVGYIKLEIVNSHIYSVTNRI